MREKLLSPRWVTDKYILLMLGIFPLWTGIKGYRAVTAAKFYFFAAATVAWLIWAGLAAIRERSFKRPAAGAFAALSLLAVAVISTALSPYGIDLIGGSGRYDGLFSLTLYVFILLGTAAWGRPRARYLSALGAGIFISCIISILQLLGKNPLWLFPDGVDYFDAGIRYSGQFLGTVGNVDVAAAYLCLAVPALFAAFIFDRRALPCLIPAALGLFIAWESGVSSARVGLAVGFAALLFILRRERLRRAGLALLLAGLIIIASQSLTFSRSGVSLEKPAAENETVSEISEILSGNIDDSFGSGRIGIWRDLLQSAAERPVIGAGVGTLSRLVDIEYERYVPETGRTLRTRVDNAHNEYLGCFAETGAAGLLCYIALIFMTAARFIKRRGSPRGVIACGLAAYCAQSFFGLGLCLVLPMVWIGFGLMWSEEGLDEKEAV